MPRKVAAKRTSLLQDTTKESSASRNMACASHATTTVPGAPSVGGVKKIRMWSMPLSAREGKTSSILPGGMVGEYVGANVRQHVVGSSVGFSVGAYVKDFVGDSVGEHVGKCVAKYASCSDVGDAIRRTSSNAVVEGAGDAICR